MVESVFAFEAWCEVLDHIQEWVYIVDRELKFRVVNLSFKEILRHFGISEDIRGKYLLDVFPLMNQEAVLAIRQVFVDGQEILTKEPTFGTLGHIHKIHRLPIIQAGEVTHVVTIVDHSTEDIESHYYTDIAAAQKTAITIQDFSANILAWDKGAEEMFGYKELEALRMNALQITPAHLHQDYLHYLNAFQKGVFIPPLEIRRITKNHRELFTYINGRVLRDEEGHPYGVALTEYDVTEIKKARLALQETEDKYKLLTDNINVGIYRSIASPNGTFTEINPAALKIFGFSNKDEALKYTIAELYYHPEDRQKFLTKITQEGHINSEEFLLKKVDGTPIWCRITSVAIKDANGNTKYYDGIIEDITEKKKAEEAILESEKRYHDLIESMAEGVVVFNSQHEIVLANSAANKIFGLHPESTVGHNLSEFVDEKNLRKFIDNTKLQLAGEETNYDLSIFTPNHNKSIVTITCSPYYLKENNENGILAVFRDVTRLRMMEEEIIKATKLESLSLLAGGIAHDFNNILTIILGNLSLSKMFIDKNDNIYKRLEKAENAALRAKDLTMQLLTFSKGGSPVKKVMAIKGLIEESVNFSLLGSKVKCELSLPDDIWPLEIDEGQISQSLNNLIINATQAMPEGGHLYISTRNTNLPEGNAFSLPAGKYVKISIEDEGIGIPEENLSKIFDPYFTTKEKGTGLGLSSVYSIIKKHDGAIGVESTVGVGTRFDIFLPAAEGTVIEKFTDSNQDLRGEGRILIMDDEDEIREVSQIMIKSLGYEVIPAKDGDEALTLFKEALVKKEPFDAVILDLTIRGGMGGKLTLQKLREVDPEVKGIVASGYSNDPIISEYEQFGFKAYIIKPFKVNDLGRILREVINHQKT